MFIRVSYIKKIKGKYRVLSEKGKNLGEYTSLKDARKRLRQIEFFKHKKASTNNEDLTYTEVCRELKDNPEKLKLFQSRYKKIFDHAWLFGIDAPSDDILHLALRDVEKINKTAAHSADLGPPDVAARHLAGIIHFVIKRISPLSRFKSLQGLKQKFLLLNPSEIAAKEMPASSAIGQAITLVKHSLIGKDAGYIKSVIDHLVRYL